MDGPKEIEVKLRVATAEAAREALRRVGAVPERERHFEDNVLLDDERGSLRASGSVLRLRRTPHGGVLTFKGPRQIAEGVKSREERETVVEDPEEARSGLDIIMGHYGGKPPFEYSEASLAKILVIRIDITSMTCKRSM